MRTSLLVAAVVGALVAPASAGALTVGIGDQQPSAFVDGRLRALGLRVARLTVPWDAAATEPAAVQSWLDAVAAAGMTPHVAFEHRRSDRCPASPCVVPSRSEYRAAVAAFHARFPQVTTFTTWNEANHQSQPVASRPEAVAASAAVGAAQLRRHDVRHHERDRRGPGRRTGQAVDRGDRRHRDAAQRRRPRDARR